MLIIVVTLIFSWTHLSDTNNSGERKAKEELGQLNLSGFGDDCALLNLTHHPRFRRGAEYVKKSTR